MTAEQIKYAYSWLGIKLRAAAMPSEDRADISQEAILAAMIRFRAFDDSRTKWKTFLCLCLSSALADILRRRRKSITFEMLEIAADIPEETDVMTLLNHLPAEIDRKIAHFRWQGFSQQKIISTLKISRAAYLAAMSRIRESILAMHQPCQTIAKKTDAPSPPIGTFSGGGGIIEVGAEPQSFSARGTKKRKLLKTNE